VASWLFAVIWRAAHDVRSGLNPEVRPKGSDFRDGSKPDTGGAEIDFRFTPRSRRKSAKSGRQSYQPPIAWTGKEVREAYPVVYQGHTPLAA